MGARNRCCNNDVCVFASYYFALSVLRGAIDRVMPLSQVGEAIHVLEARTVRGKIVLVPDTQAAD